MPLYFAYFQCMSKLVEKAPGICVKKWLQRKPFHRRTVRLIGYKRKQTLLNEKAV